MPESSHIWFNGKLVPWAEATVHVGTHALHYGTGVFEGIRAYATPRGAGIMRLEDHMLRLQRSAHLYRMALPWTVDELCAAVWETIDACQLDSCYVRPLAYRGYHELGLYPENCPVHVAIMAWTWGSYLGDDGVSNGIRAKICSVQKFSSNALPTSAKATGQYINSVLAKLEVSRSGYEEALLLDEHGYISEGSGENIFVVIDGSVRTPPRTDSILPGITRDTVRRICTELQIPWSEEHLQRQDLYTADEVFLTGTAAEVTPVRSVDDYDVGDPGPVTKRLQEAFFATTRGEQTPWSDLMEYPAT